MYKNKFPEPVLPNPKHKSHPFVHYSTRSYVLQKKKNHMCLKQILTSILFWGRTSVGCCRLYLKSNLPTITEENVFDWVCNGPSKADFCSSNLRAVCILVQF